MPHFFFHICKIKVIISFAPEGCCKDPLKHIKCLGQHPIKSFNNNSNNKDKANSPISVYQERSKMLIKEYKTFNYKMNKFGGSNAQHGDYT